MFGPFSCSIGERNVFFRIPFNGLLIRDSADFTVERNAKSEIEEGS